MTNITKSASAHLKVYIIVWIKLEVFLSIRMTTTALNIKAHDVVAIGFILLV